jgi:hypothetical protein
LLAVCAIIIILLLNSRISSKPPITYHINKRGQGFFATASTANPLLTIASRLNGFVIIEMRNLEILSSSAIKIFSSFLVFLPFNGDLLLNYSLFLIIRKMDTHIFPPRLFTLEIAKPNPEPSWLKLMCLQLSEPVKMTFVAILIPIPESLTKILDSLLFFSQ